LLVIAIVLVLVLMSYRQRLETVSPTPTATIVQVPQGPPMEEPALGIAWTPGPDAQQIVVMKILPSPPPSRLALIGVRPGDFLTEVNDEKADLGNIETALDELQNKGTPFTLTVLRGGQSVKLEAKQLPASLKGMDFRKRPATEPGG
jgi:S1-C subfamily serine protease